MMKSVPLIIHEVANLQQDGVDQTFINSTRVSLSSEKYVCILEDSQLIVIEPLFKNCTRRSILSCEAALMHPTENVLALRGTNKVIEIIDLDIRQKVAEHVLNSTILLWNWISSDILALVAEHSIYHWDFKKQFTLKVWDINESLKGCRLVRYQSCPDLKWFALTGLYDCSGSVQGRIQLFSTEKQASQCCDGNAIAMMSTTMDNQPAVLLCVVSSWSSSSSSGTLIMLKSRVNGDGQIQSRRKSLDIQFPDASPGDIPIGLELSQQLSMAFLFTKNGWLNVYDVDSALFICSAKISVSPVFLLCPLFSKSGVLTVNHAGQVLEISIDQEAIIPYLRTFLTDGAVMQIAKRNSFPGADDLFLKQYAELLKEGKYLEAAEVAVTAPNSILRNSETLKALQLVTLNNQPLPISHYYKTLMSLPGQLNRSEALVLVKSLIDRKDLGILKNLLKIKKIDCFEELGDLVREADPIAALSIYLTANIPEKVVQCFGYLGEFSKMIQYTEKVGYTPDFLPLLRRLLLKSFDLGVTFANFLVFENSMPVGPIVEILMDFNLYQQSTAILLKALDEDKPAESHLQTRLLEINLIAAPHVADAILSNRKYSYFDHKKIARLCETAGLLQRALELYHDLYDIKRVMKQTAVLNHDWVISYVGNLSAEDTLECLEDMLEIETKVNQNLCARIAATYWHQLPLNKAISLFEAKKRYEGLLTFLSCAVSHTEDENIHKKYIEACCKTGQYSLLEKFCQESNSFNPEIVKNYLKGEKLPDPRPLMIVCDRFNMIPDLVTYLYNNDMLKYIEILVQNLNPKRLPEVVETLLDLDCNENTVKSLVFNVNSSFSIEDLSNILESRGKLKLLLPWFEMKTQEQGVEKALYDALAKIYIDLRINPEKFLRENQFYDREKIGKYCEKRAPDLACIVYEGQALDFLQICYDNGFFHKAANYLSKKRDPVLWTTVLKDPKYRQSIIEQIQSATKDIEVEDVPVLIKALMSCNLHQELIQYLEALSRSNNEAFIGDKNLQNLLILTAIKVEPNRVLDLAEKLENIDAPDVANFAISNNLYEEAFIMLNNARYYGQAVTVLLDHLNDFERALNLAEKCNDSNVWSHLGAYQLRNGDIRVAVECLIKGNDHSSYAAVVEAVKASDTYWDELILYLTKIKNQSREPFIENELLYAYAKTDRLLNLKTFAQEFNLADKSAIGQRCLNQGLLEAAKILYETTNNFSGLAEIYLRMEDLQNALEAARKANNLYLWKKVALTCLDLADLRTCYIAALQVAPLIEDFEEIVERYKSYGHFEELIGLLEAAVARDVAYSGLFTELGILYARHKPDRLKSFLDSSWQRVSIPKVIQEAQDNHLWEEVANLYEKNLEFDNAVSVILNHFTETWNHSRFTEILLKVVNINKIFTKCAEFYKIYKPLFLNDFLIAVNPRLDRKKLMTWIREENLVAVVRPYLENVQGDNNREVNETLNDYLMAIEDINGLWQSIQKFNNIEEDRLAQRLSSHELLEFRKMAAYLYERKENWSQALCIYKQNELFKEAIYCVTNSGSSQEAEKLIRHYAENFYKTRPEYFGACLYHLYDLLRPDVITEIAWEHQAWNTAAPYLIQVIKDFSEDLNFLKNEVKHLNQAVDGNSKGEDRKPLMIGWKH